MADAPTPDPNSDNDPLATLHKMSTTAGVGSGDYVAINSLAVTSVLLGVATGLAVLGNILLIIPAIGIIFAIVALWQISNSNGTQSGKVLAVLGLLLCLGISGVIVGKQVADAIAVKKDSEQIDHVIEKLGGFVHNGNYDAAYKLFTPKFKERVPPDIFAAKWKAIQSSPLYGGISGMKSNQHFIVETEPNLKIRVARGLVMIKFEKTDMPAYEEMRFEQINGEWLVHDVPSFFPAQRPPNSD